MVRQTLSGGDRLASALGGISRNLRRGATVSVGFLSGATYPTGQPVAMVAAIHQFGAPARNIPPRPFFSQMIANYSGGWPDAVREQLKATDYDAEKSLGIVGEWMKGELRLSIRDVQGPPLKSATVRRKGFASLLIDTSRMVNSIDSRVEGE